MKIFPVEFSEINILLNKYRRSLKLHNMQSTLFEKLNVERRVTRMMSTVQNDLNKRVNISKNVHSSFKSPMSSIIRKVRVKKNTVNPHNKRVFQSIITRRSRQINSIAQSKSITSWLEGEITRAKQYISTPREKQKRYAFSPFLPSYR